MISGLREDIEIPKEVWGSYVDALEALPEKKVRALAGHRFAKYSVAAAAVVASAGVFAYSNPALAAKLPLIGRIFDQIGNEVTISGDYAEKAEILTSEDFNGELSTARYTVKDQGIRITASEVYSDGEAVFFTVSVESDEGGFEHIPEHFTSGDIDGGRAATFYTRSVWNVESSGINFGDDRLLLENFEGKVLDDNTFAGVMRIDLGGYDITEGTVNLNIAKVGYDDVRELDSEDASDREGIFHEIAGAWSLEIPFTVDQAAKKTVMLGMEQDGILLDKAVVTPYQVVVYTRTEEMELSGEMLLSYQGEIKKLLSKEPDLTDAEIAEILGIRYKKADVAVFGKNGQGLTFVEESTNNTDQGAAGVQRTVFAVQGEDTDSLKILVFDDDFDHWIQIWKEGADSRAAEATVITVDVNVE